MSALKSSSRLTSDSLTEKRGQTPFPLSRYSLSLKEAASLFKLPFGHPDILMGARTFVALCMLNDRMVSDCGQAR